jgi:23S rRNA pseudouridine1911/1915/1917 synthase
MIYPSILAEDNHLLVVNKPQGWITQGALPGQRSLLEWAKEDLKRRYQKPGNVYLGVVSRLDGPVSGVVPLARTSKAAARLNEQIRNRQVEKIYWALVEGTPRAASGRWVDGLLRNEAAAISRVVPLDAAGAQEAILGYRMLATDGDRSLLELKLETGRKHQLRAQLAHHGHPILGDTLYAPTGDSSGPDRRIPKAIALHCRFFGCRHPTRGEPVGWEAPLDRQWIPAGLGAPLLDWLRMART